MARGSGNYRPTAAKMLRGENEHLYYVRVLNMLLLLDKFKDSKMLIFSSLGRGEHLCPLGENAHAALADKGETED